MSFQSDAAALFGMTPAEARDLLSALKQGYGFAVSDGDSLFDRTWSTRAVDMLDYFYEEIDTADEEEDEREMWMWDDAFDWGEDDWIDADEEYEVSVIIDTGKGK
jgi:hypothetical protein